MDPLHRRPLGKTGVSVTQLGVGGAQIGDMFVKVSDEDAHHAIRSAYDAGVRYFDTSPWYGRGQSERRYGQFLRNQPRDSFVLSTKVGRVFHRPADLDAFAAKKMLGGLDFDFHWDFSYDGILRSYEDSLQRLGLNRVDLLLIHDLDVAEHGSEEAVDRHFKDLCDSGWKALDELRSSKEIQGIGAGINITGMILRFLESFDIDFFLVAMPYTLLDQDALDVELPACAERNAGLVVGAPYSSGVLATGAVQGASYNYAPASDEVLDKVRRIQAVCGRHDVPLRAAALQFPLAHSSVASIIPGVIASEQVEENIRWVGTEIPSALWEELKAEGLLRKDAPVPS